MSQIYQMIRDAGVAAGDFDSLAPSLTVRVQDEYASQTAGSASTVDGRFTSFRAIIYLRGVNSGFSVSPNAVAAHEYGHFWSSYHLYLSRQGDWSSYLSYRGLAGDSRLDSSYGWDRAEIIAEDFRLLFGSAAVLAQQPKHMNPDIPDPRDVPGLRDFLLTGWAA